MIYKKILKLAAIIIGVYLLLNLSYYIVRFGQEMYYQAKILPRVEIILGLSTGTPYIDGAEVIELHVRPEMIASNSGVMDGDILNSHSLGNFAKSIYDSRGKSFQFEVKRDDENLLITIPVVPNFEY